MKRKVDIIQMIEDRQLGSLEAEYTGEKIPATNAIKMGFIGLLISLLIDLLFTLFANRSGFSLFWSNLLPISAIVESMVFLTALGMVLPTSGTHVFFCQEGLLYVRGRKNHDVWWKSIHQVRLDVSDDPMLMFPVGFFHIVSRDGQSFTFRDPGGDLLDAFKARSVQHGFQVIKTDNGKVTKRM